MLALAYLASVVPYNSAVGSQRARAPTGVSPCVLRCETNANYRCDAGQAQCGGAVNEPAPAMATHAAWVASSQGGNKRTITDNKIIGVTSTMPAANKPSLPKMVG